MFASIYYRTFKVLDLKRKDAVKHVCLKHLDGRYSSIQKSLVEVEALSDSALLKLNQITPQLMFYG